MSSSALLDKTAKDFLGEFATGRETGIETEGFFLTGRAPIIGWRTTFPVAKNLSVTTSLSAGTYQFSRHLPKGISFFTDPAHVKVNTVFLDFKTGLQLEIENAAPARFFVEGFAGLNASKSRISINSAVLKVRNHLSKVEPYAGLRASTRFDAFPKAEPWISLQVGGSGYREISVGVRHNF